METSSVMRGPGITGVSRGGGVWDKLSGGVRGTGSTGVVTLGLVMPNFAEASLGRKFWSGIF